MNPLIAPAAHRVALVSLCCLIVLCILWEWLIAPIRPGGSWMILKALPLMIPLQGILTNQIKRRYTYQWATLFVWIYFTEGIVRAWSDLAPLSRSMATIEVLLAIVFYVAAVIYVRNTPSHLAGEQP